MPKQFHDDAERAARMLASSEDVLIVAHIDADGIASASIAAKTCERLGKKYETLFVKKMDENVIDTINNGRTSLVWIVDLGSGYLSAYTRDGILVTDHHVPDTKWRRGQTFLDDYSDICHLNPHNYGLNGSTEVCGAGMTYTVSKFVDPSNMDLAFLAVIGACGDLQDYSESKLVGYNRAILNDAVANGDVIAEEDLRLFGRETRSLVHFLQFSNDPVLPGLTNDGDGCANFFSDLGIDLKRGNQWRSWNDLSTNEKERTDDALLKLVGAENENRLFGEVYTLPNFTRKSGLRDAKEFATLLNSCGRYDDAATGMRICLGDMSAIEDANANRTEHRHNIAAALSFVKQNDVIRIRKYVQYFNAGDAIKETIVGIVAGMILNSNGFRKDLPMIAFADADDGVKVSARADKSLTDRGLDLSVVMTTASKIVGGYGGGHNIAAGATIPKGKEKEFLDIVEDLVSSQII